MDLKETLPYEKNSLLNMYWLSPGSYFLHWHHELEFVFVTKGTILYGVNQQLLKLEEGDFIIVTPGDIHWLQNNVGDGEVFMLVISREFLNHTFDARLFNTALFTKKTIAQNPDYSKIYPTLLELYDEYEHDKKTWSEELLRLNLQLLLYHCLRCLNDSIPLALSDHQSRETDVCRIIMDFFSTVSPMDYHLDKLADLLGYSPNHLCKVFRRIFHKSFYQYALEYKMHLAKEYLKKTDLSITEIAEKSGFSTIRAFNTAFKKAFGIPPGEFRRLHT